MNVTLDYRFTVKLFEKLGGDKFIELFSDLYDFDLYSMSKDWLNNRKFILKFRGSHGDLIVYWN